MHKASNSNDSPVVRELSDKIAKLHQEKLVLMRERIVLEYRILGKENPIIHKGSSYWEMLYGELQKNATRARIEQNFDRMRNLKRESRKPFNLFYAEQIKTINKKIARIRKEILDARQKKRQVIQRDCELFEPENEMLSLQEMFGVEYYSELTAEQKTQYKRIMARHRQFEKKLNNFQKST